MVARSELEAAQARAADLWICHKALKYRLRLAHLKFQTMLLRA
jgi:hypothetical protein